MRLGFRPDTAPPLDAGGRLGQGLRLEGICPPRSTACQAPAPTRPSDWSGGPGPVVVLVEPQLGENIGAAARAMANFGLSRLRLVRPRQGWPNEKARVMATGAARILDDAALFDTLEAAIADCSLVLAATARAHDQAKPVVGPAEAAGLMAPRIQSGETVAILFGRERNGLENDEVALADCIVTLPVNPAFASLNLAQAVVDRRLRMVQARGRRPAVRHAGEITPRAEGATARVLQVARART